MRVKRLFTAIVATLALMPLQMLAQDAENEADLMQEKKTLILQGFTDVSDEEFAKNARKMMDAQGAGMVTLLDFYRQAQDAEEKAVFEHTIVEIAKYVGGGGRMKDKTTLRTVLSEYIDSHDDYPTNCFVASLFSYFIANNDVEYLWKYTEDPRYADAMIRILAQVPSFANSIDKGLKKNKGNLNPKGAYAYAIGKLGMKDKEDVLISWIKKADVPAKIDIYNALLVVGSEKSKPVVEKGAKKLYKNKNPEVKIAGMRLLATIKGSESMPYLYKSLKNKNQNVRREALTLMIPYSDDAVRALVVKKYAKKEVLPDVVEWLGNLHDKSQLAFVEQQLSSDNREAVEAAIWAVTKINDENAMKKLVPLLDGDYAEVAKKALMECNGSIVPVLIDATRGNDRQKLAALAIVGEKHMKLLFNRVAELLENGSPEVRDAAYATLKDVTTVSNGEYLINLLQTCDTKRVTDVQDAIIAAYANAKVEQKYIFKSRLKYVSDDIRPRFDKVLESMGLNWD